MNDFTRYTAYDHLAWFYDRYMGAGFLDVYRDVLRDLFVSRTRTEANVLDLCCGTGQLSAWLTEQGYHVTGVDGSREMLSLAQHNAPGAQFLCRDVRSFQIVEMFTGALCTFDSLNHVQSLLELGRVFNNVYTALKSGGRFVFDVNTEDGLQERWNSTSSVIEKDHVLAGAMSYDPKRKIATARFAAFRHRRKWERQDVEICERPFTASEVEKRLAKSFFKNVRFYDARRDFKKPETGRLFFVCEK